MNRRAQKHARTRSRDHGIVRSSWLAAAGAAALCTLAPAAAQPAATTGNASSASAAPSNPGAHSLPAADPQRSPLALLVADLSSDDFQRRMLADEELRSRSDLTLSAIEELLRTPNLDAEQRSRLASLAWERFTTGPRGALGIQYNQPFMRDRRDGPAVISRTVENFDSQRVLRAGDAIVSFDGSRITDRIALKPHILSYEPGEIAQLEVERDEAVLQVEVRMGSQDDLNQISDEDQLLLGGRRLGPSNPISSDELEQAWELRLARRQVVAADRDAVLDGELSAARWRQAIEEVAPAAGSRAADRLTIAAGGAPRGGSPESMRPFAEGEFAIQNTVVFREQDWQRQQQQAIRNMNAAIAGIQARLDSIDDEQIAKLTPAERAAHQNELARLARFIEERNRLLRGIQGRNALPGVNQPRR